MVQEPPAETDYGAGVEAVGSIRCEPIRTQKP